MRPYMTPKDLINRFAKIWQKSQTKSTPVEPPQSSLFVNSLPTNPSAKEVLRFSGSLICKVLVQVARRAGLQTSDFNTSVEFDKGNSASSTLRVMVAMPAASALTLVQCSEIERISRIELEIRFAVSLSSVFWRIKDADVTSGASTVIGGHAKPDLSEKTDSNLSMRNRLLKNKYPAPVRLAPPLREDGLFLNTDREATDSELRAFNDILSAALSVPNKTTEPTDLADAQK